MLLHVGYHKTATTWLQRRIFNAAPFTAPYSFDAIVDGIVRPHPLEWDEDRARETFADRETGCVISCEELLGNPHVGAYNAKELASRLAAVFPGARVLITIRRQPGMLVSTYKQYVHRGGVLTPRRYFEPGEADFRQPRFRLAHYEYDRVIRLYHERFGRENVLVLTFEQFRSDPDAFLGAIARHAGVEPPILDESAAPERVSLCAGTLALQRPLNRIFQRDDVNPAGLWRCECLRPWMSHLNGIVRRLPGNWCERRLTRWVDRLCRGRFGASNARVADLTGLPLGDLGYDVQ